MMKARWWWVIGAGIAVVCAGVVTIAVLGFMAYVRHSISETSPDQPFLTGAPQDPTAKSPISCPDQCFTLQGIEAMFVSAADLAPLGITNESKPAGSLDPSTVSVLAAATADGWAKQGGDEDCAFLPANAPYFATRTGSDATSSDPIFWLQVWQTGDELMDLSGRVFPTADAASAFLHQIHDHVAACPWVDLAGVRTSGGDTALVQVTAQAAVPVPDEVAAAGWVREGEAGPRWRAYVWDLQRGNAVLEVRVFTDGRISERQVATLTETLATRLSQLPVG